MRILIAEDNANNRDLLERRLQRQGWQVIVATDGVEAVEQCQAHAPDLILMDVTMPRMTGLEAARKLRADPATATVRIIAVTAHAMEESKLECLAAGCDDFVAKPIDFPVLFEKIRALLDQQGARLVA